MAGATDEHGDRDSAPEPGRTERPRLRRSPFGYRRADVDHAIDARDAELAELRRDVAALWLAFAQHDRMLRALSGGPPVAPPVPESGSVTRDESGTAAIADEASSIGEQLSELDDVLAAIEMATQTLERTYAEEIRGPRTERSASDPPAEGDGERPT